MKNYFEIENAGQLKAIADPLRRRLLEVFASGPITTKQAASLIDEKPTKLYHHVDFLEQSGLIKLVGTRPNRGTTEKYYQSVARKFAVRKELVEVGSANDSELQELENVLVETLEDSLRNLRKSLDDKLLQSSNLPKAIALINTEVYLNEAQVNELAEVVQSWLEKNDTLKSEGKSPHQLTMVVFPNRPK